MCRAQLYSHITIATDPDNVRFVFAAVKHTILTGIVQEIFNTDSDYLQENILVISIFIHYIASLLFLVLWMFMIIFLD